MSAIQLGICIRLSRAWRNQTGTALIETALALPLFCLMLLGAAEFGRLAFASIEVSNAARAAADYGGSAHGAASDWTLSGSTYSGGVVSAATNDAAELSGLTVTGISLSCSCAPSSSVTSPTQPKNNSCTDNQTCKGQNVSVVETITVSTQANYDPLIHYPGGPSTLTLTAHASQTVSNQ